MKDEKKEGIDPLQKIVIGEEKVSPIAFLRFNGMEDIKELIGFTGLKPRVTEDGKLQIKKWLLEPPCLVQRGSDNSVVDILSLQDFNKKFIVKETKDFSTAFKALKDI